MSRCLGRPVCWMPQRSGFSPAVSSRYWLRMLRQGSDSWRTTRMSTQPSRGASVNWSVRWPASSTPGRSRNDQVALDLRLYLRRSAAARIAQLREFALTMLRTGRGRRGDCGRRIHAPAAGPGGPVGPSPSGLCVRCGARCRAFPPVGGTARCFSSGRGRAGWQQPSHRPGPLRRAAGDGRPVCQLDGYGGRPGSCRRIRLRMYPGPRSPVAVG